MPPETTTPAVVTVTLHPAIDWTLRVPGFEPGAVNRAEAHTTEPAGKGVNVAVNLAAHGVAVAATGFLGRSNAALFEALFERTGVADHFVRIDGWTRRAVKIVDPDGEQTTDVNLSGPAPSAQDRQALTDALAALSASCPVVVLAGSLPPGVEAGAYRELTRTLRRAGCRVVLDTSGTALAKALSADADALPDVVKPNVHELETLVGRDLPDVEAVAAAARDLVRRGVGRVVVSRGDEGALFVERGRIVEAIPPSVEIHSTVGAGDALVAGLVAGDLAGLDLADVARRATAFSLDALTRHGDEAHIEIAEWAEGVTVRERPDLAA